MGTYSQVLVIGVWGDSSGDMGTNLAYLDLGSDRAPSKFQHQHNIRVPSWMMATSSVGVMVDKDNWAMVNRQSRRFIF